MKAFHPDRYHGHPGLKDFFEGWYFKLVDPTGQHVFAFIPGIFLGKKAEYSHSFLQVLDGRTCRYLYQQDRPETFRFENPFSIKVGENRFSFEGVHLDLHSPEISVEGDLSFRDVARWPDSPCSPGSMGWYNFVPGMQCYSQVCAMDLEIAGVFRVDGQKIDFTGGRGYIEKNWGKAFPHSWVWIQSNSFGTERVSLSVSLGEVPFWPKTFRGFLIGLLVNERFFRWTTMNHSRLSLTSEGSDVILEATNRHHRLRLRTRTDQEKFILCQGPRDGEMIPLVRENLQGVVELELSDRKSGKILFAGEGQATGIEYGGRQMALYEQAIR